MMQREAMGTINRILVVEDDPPLARALSRTFSQAGLSVTIAGCGFGALDALRAEIYDLVLFDIGLPDVEGVDLARAMLACDSPALVIAMSGVPNGAQVFELASIGVDGFIQKPFDVATIGDAIFEARAVAIDMDAIARNCVRRGIHLGSAVGELRRCMFRRALSETGSSRGAARLLGVSRSAVQKARKTLDL